jgi:sensor histidine kinase regulating citrate/malate metabolism
MKASKLEQEKQKMESLLAMEQEQYRLSRETIDAVNRKCHDLKHQIRNIRKGLADEDTADALAEMERAVMFYDVIAKTGNDALDSILTEKSLVCERFHIQFHYMADGKILSFIRHVDLYALLGNALDNAIECEERIEVVAKRMIFLNIALRGETLHIHLENYCEAQPQFKDGFPVTTKADRDSHGIGTKSIAYIVKKYGGNTVFGWEGGLFRLDITVPVP